MAVFTGADKKYKPSEQRVDTRLLSQRLAEEWKEPEGGTMLNLGLLTSSIITMGLPALPVVSSIVTKVFSMMFLNPQEKLQDLPFRMPETIEGYDGSEMMPDKPFEVKANRKFYKPQGVTYYGRDLKSMMQVWASDDDDRTHTNIFGTTGSGKTELIHTITTNQLIRNSGAIIVDAKGDISLYRRMCNLVRRFGRDADLLCITFAIGSEDPNLPQSTKNTNSFNLMLNTSSGMLIELLSGLLDGDGGSDDMWKSRAIAFIGALTQPLVFLRDKQEIELAPATYIDYMELPEIERFVYESDYESKYEGFDEVVKPLRSYLTTLPGYNPNLIGNQAQQTNEQFGYITMQMTRSINDLGFTYGHIFGTAVGEIDISDVVLNRRFLVILLPSLERSLPTLLMLSRLIIGSLKQMMASSLGSKVSGSIRINVDSRPTTALNCFRIVLDEVGYMMTTGMSIIPAQARSLNIAMVFAAQDFTDIERGSKEEAQAIWSNAAIKFIGRLTAGEESEMWRRTRSTAGEIEQAVIYQYEREFSPTMNVRYRAGGQVSKEKQSQIKYEEVAAQTKGQFTLLSPKKYQGGRYGGVAVVHFQCLFTGGMAEMDVMYINDFVPMSTASIEPPNLTSQYKFLSKHLKEGTLCQQMDASLSLNFSVTLEGNQTAQNSVSKYLMTVKDSCLNQSSDEGEDFSNMMLEVSLGFLNLAMSGLADGNAVDPDNLLLSQEAIRDFWSEESGSEVVTSNLEQVSSVDFERDPDVQAAHYVSVNQDEEPPVEIIESIEGVRATGRAVDLEKDKHIKELIREYEEGSDFSLETFFEDDEDDARDTIHQMMLACVEQTTLGDNTLIKNKLLKMNVEDASYISGVELDKSQLEDLRLELKSLFD